MAHDKEKAGPVDDEERMDKSADYNARGYVENLRNLGLKDATIDQIIHANRMWIGFLRSTHEDQPDDLIPYSDEVDFRKMQDWVLKMSDKARGQVRDETKT